MNEQLIKLSQINLGKYEWINVYTDQADILKYLGNKYSLHPLDLEDCLSKTQLPKVEEYKDYLFAILHFPKFLKAKKYSIAEQVSIFLGRNFLITVHSEKLKPINSTFQKFITKIDEDVPESPAFLLYKLIHSLIDDVMRMLNKVLDNLSKAEDRVFDDTKSDVREITDLRHDIANLRRIILTLKRVIHELEKKVQKFSEGDIGMYFSDLADFIDKAWAILEECRETIEIYKDTDFIIGTDKTNKILAILTIIFTFTIPATVIGTLYGMNINLPGAIETGAWQFWGTYTTLWIVLIISVLPAIVMYMIFRKRKWL